MIRYRIASSLGPQYMIPQHVKDLHTAEAFMENYSKHLAGLPGSDTVRIEWRDDIKQGPWRKRFGAEESKLEFGKFRAAADTGQW